MKKKIIFIAPQTKSLINFRGDLMIDIINKGYEVIAITPEKEQEDFFKKNNIKVSLIKLNKNSTSILKTISYYRKLKKIIKKENPDKVFSYTIKPVIFGSIAAHKAGVKDIYSLVCGLGYVYTANNLKHKILQLICGKAYKIAFKYNKRVIFQNQDDMNEFTERKYLKKEKCELVNGSGVNLSKFKRNKLPKNISFLMVSRILKEKGVLEYFEAAKRVKEKHDNIKFTYVGQLDEGKNAIKYEDLRQYIDKKIVKYIPYTKCVEEYYKKCSVFVLPSYYREGIPRTLIEATAMGRPIITTNMPGCKETIINNKNGIFVATKNVEQLTKAMLYMIENSNRLQNMGNESYKICINKFDITIINKQMLKIMDI